MSRSFINNAGLKDDDIEEIFLDDYLEEDIYQTTREEE